MIRKSKIFFIILIIILFSIISIFLYIKLSNVENLATFKEWFAPTLKGYLLYFLLVVLQILFIPISTMVLIVPALIMFGAWTTFLITLLALILGSAITFYIGYFCRSFAVKFINKNATFMKWYYELEKNGKFLLPYFSIIPIFPDEIICLLAGVTKMNFWYFLLVTAISRALHLIFVCFLGAIIPMHGWWLVLWIIILLLITYACFILNKKQFKIKEWFNNKFIK